MPLCCKICGNKAILKRPKTVSCVYYAIICHCLLRTTPPATLILIYLSTVSKIKFLIDWCFCQFRIHLISGDQWLPTFQWFSGLNIWFFLGISMSSNWGFWDIVSVDMKCLFFCIEPMDPLQSIDPTESIDTVELINTAELTDLVKSIVPLQQGLNNGWNRWSRKIDNSWW